MFRNLPTIRRFFHKAAKMPSPLKYSCREHYSYGNRNSGSAFEHNNYTAAIGIVFQYNRFGPFRPNSVGAGLKDRSARTVIRYNRIEGGNRNIDVVDGEDSSLIRNFWLNEQDVQSGVSSASQNYSLTSKLYFLIELFSKFCELRAKRRQFGFESFDLSLKIFHSFALATRNGTLPGDR
jgi:hypothetical protein